MIKKPGTGSSLCEPKDYLADTPDVTQPNLSTPFILYHAPHKNSSQNPNQIFYSKISCGFGCTWKLQTINFTLNSGWAKQLSQKHQKVQFHHRCGMYTYSRLHTNWALRIELLPFYHKYKFKATTWYKTALGQTFVVKTRTLSFLPCSKFWAMVKNSANFYLPLTFEGPIGNGKTEVHSVCKTLYMVKTALGQTSVVNTRTFSFLPCVKLWTMVKDH